MEGTRNRILRASPCRWRDYCWTPSRRIIAAFPTERAEERNALILRSNSGCGSTGRSRAAMFGGYLTTLRVGELQAIYVYADLAIKQKLSMRALVKDY